jgi:hypothetical protein
VFDRRLDMHSGYEVHVIDHYRALSFCRQVLFLASEGADEPFARPRPGTPPCSISSHSTSALGSGTRAGAGPHPSPHRSGRGGRRRCDGLGRRPGRRRTSGSRSSGSGSDGARLYGADHRSWNFGTYHDYIGGSINRADDDGAAHTRADKAGGHLGGLGGPLGRGPMQHISTSRRTNFSLEA